MHTTELHGDTVTAEQEQQLRAFTESLPPCALRTALYDVLEALSFTGVARVSIPNLWGWDAEDDEAVA